MRIKPREKDNDLKESLNWFFIVLGIGFMSTLSGFGMFWFYRLMDNGVFISIGMGCFYSSMTTIIFLLISPMLIFNKKQISNINKYNKIKEE